MFPGAVMRRRLMPSGTDGGRKQPTAIPRARSCSAARTADSGVTMGTDCTAALACGTFSVVATNRARSCNRSASSGASPMIRAASVAAAEDAGCQGRVEDERARRVHQVLPQCG